MGLRTPTLQTRATIFDFHNQFNSPGSKERVQRSSQASNPLDENLSFFQPVSNNIRDLPHAEGFIYVGPIWRPYFMQNRTRWVSSEGRSSDLAPSKVSLESVHNGIVTEGCKRNCLTDVPARYILDMRYSAWGSKYPIRSTWVRQMLVSFYTRTNGTCRDKFVTKLDGKQVCNACYALAVGYSQRRFNP